MASLPREVERAETVSESSMDDVVAVTEPATKFLIHFKPDQAPEGRRVSSHSSKLFAILDHFYFKPCFVNTARINFRFFLNEGHMS